MSRLAGLHSVLPLLALGALACAHVPSVSSERLPVRKVVIYRNGVAYFERAGEVHDDKVDFQVKPDHVGDFLATLSVMERGGSSVRSASFPISEEESQPPKPSDGGDAPTSSLKTVTLELDGREHDLRVGYVSEQPVWKPSYRLVFESGKPTLQAWGIVQNLSGEDWRDVQLSLVAGAPIAFASTLATPVTPPRPVVSDSGELITAVPHGENVLAQDETRAAAEPSPSTGAVAPAAPPPPPKGSRRGGYAPAKDSMLAADTETSSEANAPADVAGSQLPRASAVLARAEVQGGTTRYDLPYRVSIPNDSATMVLITSTPVPGESVFMFAPEGGVPDSARHPFRVVRFTNSTPGLLERGPIAVLESGAFLGQGVLEPLPAGAEATVPFALERALAVQANTRWDQQASRLAKIENGQLTIERDQVLRTTYKVQNGDSKAARVLVRHPRNSAMRLAAAPVGTQDRVALGNALVPVDVKARSTTEAFVEERRAYSQSVDWMSEEANSAVKGYLADGRAEPKLAAALRSAWGLRESFRQTTEARQKLEGERRIVAQALEEARENLNALKRNSGSKVDELRQKLAARLTELGRRSSELSTTATELDLKANELRIRFTDAVRELHLERGLVPVPPTQL